MASHHEHKHDDGSEGSFPPPPSGRLSRDSSGSRSSDPPSFEAPSTSLDFGFSSDAKDSPAGTDASDFDFRAHSKGIPAGAVGDLFSATVAGDDSGFPSSNITRSWAAQPAFAFPSRDLPSSGAADTDAEEYLDMRANDVVYRSIGGISVAPNIPGHAGGPSLAHLSGHDAGFPRLGTFLSSLEASPSKRPPVATAASFSTTKTSVDSGEVTVPQLPSKPFFLMETHATVKAEVVDDVLEVLTSKLTELEVAYDFKPQKCKFKCTYHTAQGAVNFHMRLFKKRKSPGTLFVEFQRRSGCAYLHSFVFRSVLSALAGEMECLMGEKNEPVSPVQPASPSLRPKEVPAEIAELCPPAPMSSDAVEPIVSMLQSPFDQLCQQGAKTASSILSSDTTAAELVKSGRVVEAIGSVLADDKRSASCLTHAAIALRLVSEHDAGQLKLLRANCLKSVLNRAKTVPRLDTWHLIRESVRTLKNLCTSSDPVVRQQLRKNGPVAETLRLIFSQGSSVPDCVQDDVKRSLTALQALSV